MDGYTVAARIERAHPRFVAGQGRAPASGSWAATTREASQPLPLAAAEASAGEAIEATVLGDRWDAFRDRWSQLTFFLFDADSWRS